MSHYEALQHLHEALQVDPVPHPMSRFLIGLGARVCYARKIENEVVERKSKVMGETTYLKRVLLKMGHTSPAAHAPVLVKLDYDKFQQFRLWNIFKGQWWRCGFDMCGALNARHIIEALPAERAIEWINNLPEVEKPGWTSIVIVAEHPKKGKVDLGRTTKVYLWAFPDWDWFVALIIGVSRVTTHQIVRHQGLNFNQQSQRYVTMGGVAPLAYRELDNKIDISNLLADTRVVFERASLVLPREDARYFAPQIMGSNILVSGPSWAWKHFLEVRTDSAAQWEIRAIAQAIEKGFKDFLQETTFPPIASKALLW